MPTELLELSVSLGMQQQAHGGLEALCANPNVRAVAELGIGTYGVEIRRGRW